MPLAVPPDPPVVQVEAGWFLGAYRYSQTPAADAEGPLYPARLSQGWGEDSPPAEARGLAVRARARLTDRLGLEASFNQATWAESLHGSGPLPSPRQEERPLAQGALSAVVHRPIPLGPARVDPTARVGGWASSLVLHGLDATWPAELEPAVRETWTGGLLAGGGLDLAVGRGWGAGAGAAVGFTTDLSPAWTSAELRASRSLLAGFYVAADLSWSGRLLDITLPDDAGSAGTVSDQLSAAVIALGYGL